MDITSMLNRPSAPEGAGEQRRGMTPPSVVEGGFTAPSSVLSTPSPDWTPGTHEYDSQDCKSRRPWDAGGYSLPLSVDTKLSSSASSPFRTPTDSVDLIPSYAGSNSTGHFRNGSVDSNCIEMTDFDIVTPLRNPQTMRPMYSNAYTDTPAETSGERSVYGEQRLPHQHSFRSTYWSEPGSSASVERSDAPRHKFSDSRSSFSSYASSTFSGCHSRYSSMSTVSGAHSGGLVLTELPSFDTKLAQLSGSAGVPTLGEVRPPSPRSSSSRPFEYTPAPQSPCSALPNTRAAIEACQGPLDVPSTFPHGHVTAHPLFKNHKRAISAPDFASNPRPFSSKHFLPVLPPLYTGMTMTAHARDRQSRSRRKQAARARSFDNPAALQTSQPLAPAPTTASCPGHFREMVQHGVSPSSTLEPAANMALFSSSASQAPTTPKADIGSAASTPRSDLGILEQKCVCMFVENCDTNSQLRKAISHFFGRNKSCIRCIPEWVWVHYCRKHYQRGRYRNGGKYPLTQMVLVKLQIERMETWSGNNKKTASGPYIESWTLAIRKREQNRIDSQAASDNAGNDASASSGGSRVPDWMFDHLGSGHSVSHILEIVERIRDEIEHGSLSQVPDVEFLPEIVNAGNASTPAKAVKAPKRKSFQATSGTPAAHYPVGTQQQGYSAAPPSPEAPPFAPRVDEGLPSEKRQRTDKHVLSTGHASGMTSPVPLSRAFENEPRRAPQIVPRIQFNETQSSTYCHAFNSNTGIHSSGGYGPAQQRLPPARSGVSIMDSRRLPPIASVHGSSASWLSGPSGDMSSSSAYMDSNSLAPARGAHHRAISEFKPINRGVPDVVRPSSSGDGAPAAPMAQGQNMTFGYRTSSHVANRSHQDESRSQRYGEPLNGHFRMLPPTPRLAPLHMLDGPNKLGPHGPPSASTLPPSRLELEGNWQRTGSPYEGSGSPAYMERRTSSHSDEASNTSS